MIKLRLNNVFRKSQTIEEKYPKTQFTWRVILVVFGPPLNHGASRASVHAVLWMLTHTFHCHTYKEVLLKEIDEE